MGGDPFRHVQVGDPPGVPVVVWNAILDAIRKIVGATIATRGGKQFDPEKATILVRNDSGADRACFDVLGIDTPLVSPVGGTGYLDEFAARLAVSGITPAAGHARRFCVLQEALASGAIGRAIIAGTTIARVNATTSATGTFVKAGSGVTTALVQDASGIGEVLWAESGTGDGKYAIVRIGSMDASGSDPDATRVVRGYVSTGAQEFGGIKTFWDGLIAGDATNLFGGITSYGPAVFGLETPLVPAISVPQNSAGGNVILPGCTIDFSDALSNLGSYPAFDYPAVELSGTVVTDGFPAADYLYFAKSPDGIYGVAASADVWVWCRDGLTFGVDAGMAYWPGFGLKIGADEIYVRGLDQGLSGTIGVGAQASGGIVVDLGTGGGSPLPVTSGGTGLATVTTGDILYASATDTLSALAIGAAGDVLTVSGGVPTWAPAAGATESSSRSWMGI